MEPTILRCEHESRLPEIAKSVADIISGQNVIAIRGQMGAGKTTLIRHLCEALNVVDTVSSPTFSLVNEYRTAGGKTIFHFDFYRIKNLAEALDMGVDEYLGSGDLCLIEWPEMIEPLLNKHYTTIEIAIKDGARIFTISLPDFAG